MLRLVEFGLAVLEKKIKCEKLTTTMTMTDDGLILIRKA